MRRVRNNNRYIWIVKRRVAYVTSYIACTGFFNALLRIPSPSYQDIYSQYQLRRAYEKGIFD